jgi:hypothetical protein
MSEQDSLVQYGSSASSCDFILNHQLEELQPLQIVDFGAGGGKNGKIARKILQDRVSLVAVEGSEKTANMLSNEGPYDEVCNALIQDWVLKDSNMYDLAIFGDVLEHLKPKDIHAVIKRCHHKFRHLIVICPLHEIFQEDNYGNPLEVHQTYITSNFFDRYNCIEKHIIKRKEWTIMNVHILTACESKPILRKLSWLMFHRTMLILQPLGMARPFVNFLKRYFLKYKKLLRD